jgi:branched-chain amino acid transport system permease protein
METGSILAQLVISGILLGGIYCIIAAGLSLIWGVTETINFAHGDYMMIAMYMCYWPWFFFGVDPLIMTPIVAVIMFFLGILTFKFLIQKLLKYHPLEQIFCTLGLSIFASSMAYFVFSPNFRSIGNNFLSGTITLPGVSISKPQLVSSILAMIVGLALWTLVKKTRIGRAIQAVSENKEVAELMGINSNKILALAWGVGCMLVGIAGGLLSTFYYIFPLVGFTFCIVAYVAVALGGFGSIPGSFIAGFIIGLVQVLMSYYVSAPFKFAFVYGIYLLVVFIRPKGLLGEF